MSIGVDTTQYNYIKKLLHIQDNKIYITAIEEKYINNIITNIICVSREIEPTICPDCKSSNYISHNKYTRSIKYADIAGYNTLLKYTQRRYKCKDCGKTFNEPCYLANSSSTISNA